MFRLLKSGVIPLAYTAKPFLVGYNRVKSQFLSTMEKTTSAKASILELQCYAQNYDWGKVGSDSLVYQLIQKTHRSSVKLDESKPYAELWMGTHPNLPSSVVLDEHNHVPLPEVIAKAPEHYLGEKLKDHTGLPFLFKVLSIRKALSIQLHPNKGKAEELFKTHGSIYKDPNHKPEAAIALSKFEALCNLRPYPEMSAMLKELTAALPTLFPASLITEFLQPTGNHATILKELLNILLSLKEEDLKKIMDEYLKHIAGKAAKNDRDDLILRLQEQFPHDVGILVSNFLNYVTLAPGEALALEPDEPHAYISGDIVEMMANSDNVIRVGLTPKLKDKENLLKILKVEMKDSSFVKPDEITVEKGVTIKKYRSNHKEFVCYSIMLEAQAVAESLLFDNPGILLVHEGQCEVRSKDEVKYGAAGKVFLVAPGNRFNLVNSKADGKLAVYLCTSQY